MEVIIAQVTSKKVPPGSTRGTKHTHSTKLHILSQKRHKRVQYSSLMRSKSDTVRHR